MVSKQSGNMDCVQTTSGKFVAWQSKDFMLLMKYLHAPGGT